MTAGRAFVIFQGQGHLRSKFRKCLKSARGTCRSLREVGKAYLTIKVKGKVQGQTKNLKTPQKNHRRVRGPCWVGGGPKRQVGG